MFADFWYLVLFLVTEGHVIWAPQIDKLLCASSRKECRLLIVFCVGGDTFWAIRRKLFLCASFLGSCMETCEARSPHAILSKGICILHQRDVSSIQCWANHWNILWYLCSRYQWVSYELGQSLAIICGLIIFGLGLVLLQEEFDVVLCHDCILDLWCVLSRDPFVINDEHGPAPRVRGDELVDIGGGNPVVGLFTSASFIHVAIHSSFRREGFFAVVIVLVGPEPFQVGWCFCFFSEFVAS